MSQIGASRTFMCHTSKNRFTVLVLAYCYEEKGEKEKAVSQLKTAVRVIEAFDGDIDVNFFMGTVYEKRKHEIPITNERISRLTQ